MHPTDQHYPYVSCNLQLQLDNQHQHGYFLFYPRVLPILTGSTRVMVSEHCYGSVIDPPNYKEFNTINNCFSKS